MSDDTRDPDLSVEALMARLRESARNESATDAPVEAGPSAVRDALRGQADFNQSVAQALRWTVQHLRHLQDSVAGCEQRLRELTQLQGAATGPGEPPFDYLLFEQQFRGPLEEIKRRQAAYLDLFLGRREVLDLGCGRGEFLELLTGHGIPVTGVDQSRVMVDLCHGRGLRAVQADLFAYLEGLPEHSLDGVFAAQVVEHFPPAAIARLIGLCGRKLQPGGVMVAETMNPGCPVALGHFYLDPTHVRPVPAELLRFLFEQAPFEVRCLRFSAPAGDGNLAEVLELPSAITPEAQQYQDYAVVAVRRPGEEACGS